MKNDLAARLGYYQKELFAHLDRESHLWPYANRLKTRLVVTNSLEAHLQPDTPKDIAIYYYVPGIPDEQLLEWRLAIIETWVFAISSHDPKFPVADLNNGRLDVHSGSITKYPTGQSAVERDRIHELGYNLIIGTPQYPWPFISDSIIWRNGVRVDTPVMTGGWKPEDPSYWSNVATPLALVY